MSTGLVQAVIVVLFALACGGLVLAWTRGRLGVAAVALLAVAVLVWIAALVAIASEWRGANDFATCGDSCDASHYVVSVAFIAPPLLISLAALAMLVSRGGRWRARRAARQGGGA
jgi:hypothetical protein